MVAKSSTESEYIASEASSEAVWMKRFIVELGVVPSALDPLVIYCDNMGAIANAQEPRSHKRLKHIKLRYHSIREYIEDGEVLEGSRKVRKKSLRKEESRRDSTSPWPANPRGESKVDSTKGAGHPPSWKDQTQIATAVTVSSGGDGGDDGGDDDDGDGDDVQLDDGDDGVDFPSRREFPRRIPARRRALSLWCSPPRRGGCNSSRGTLCGLGVRDEGFREEKEAKGVVGPPHHMAAWPGPWAAPP
ncbi:hypothetical protein QYE76_001897 [Lolium multiflorum]|uniref:Retrotransposon protein n=1 Tax=Lolium multiflorum TaxID=4521 RepID=A0AAD8RNQ0_LOLMU|nr:hypothetical protein QYE76_001897 [Lolium multiflorum]